MTQKSVKIKQVALLPPENIGNYCQLSCRSSRTEPTKNNNRQRLQSQVSVTFPLFFSQVGFELNCNFLFMQWYNQQELVYQIKLIFDHFANIVAWGKKTQRSWELSLHLPGGGGESVIIIKVFCFINILFLVFDFQLNGVRQFMAKK